MADTYGVKVRLEYETNKSDLREQLQKLLDDATVKKPLYIHHFKVQKEGLTKALAEGFKSMKTPLKLSNVTLNLSPDAVTGLQSQLDAKGITLTIKKIKADSAVSNLRADLVKMLSGLNIGGVKEFLGDTGIKEDNKEVVSYTANLQRLQGMLSAIKKVNTKLNTFGTAEDVQQMLTLYSQLNNEINLAIAAGGQWDNIDGLQDQVLQLNDMLAAYQKLIAAQKESAAQSARTASASDNALIIQLRGLQTMANRVGNQTYGPKAEVDQVLALNLQYAELTQKIQAALASDEARSQGVIDNLRAEITALYERSNAMKAASNAEEVVLAPDRQRVTLLSQMQGWLERNTKASSETKESIRGMMAELSNPNLPMSKLQEMQTRMKTLEVQTKATGKAGKTFFDTFKAGLEKFGGWSLVTKTLTAVWRTMHQMYDAVVQLDTAMTELRRVTDLTEQGYKNFQKTAASVAKEIGATVSDTVNATADFARLGYDIEEAAELAKAALTYKNIGDGINDITVATESLVSTMAAFKELSTEDAMYVVDMFNEVGNRFAISSKGIGDALQRSSAALSAAGNSIQESIGLVTAVNEIVQDPDSVGTAMKTLTMYLRAAKTEAEDAGVATDGMANSVSELRQGILDLTGQQVDIMLDDETFKSTFQIMQEISRVWKDMSDTSRSNLLNMIGGKRNANMFAALIENFAHAEQAADAAMGALGSATVENWQYLDSIEGKIATLTASFQELSASVLDSELIKWGVDALNLVTQFATWLAKIGALVPTIAAGLTAFDVAKQWNSLQQLISDFDSLLQSHTKDGIVDGSALGGAIKASLSGYSTAFKEQYIALLQNSVAFKSLNSDIQQNILQQLSLQTTTASTATGFTKLGTAIKSGWAAMSMFGKISLAVTVLSTIYSIIKKMVDDSAQKNQEALEAAQKLNETYENETSTLTEQRKAIADLRTEYASLASGADNGARGALTEKQYERYLQIVRQIAEISPELVARYNDEGEAIELVTGAIDKAIDKYDELIEKQREALVAQGSTLFQGNSKNYSDAVEKVQDAFFKLFSEGIFGENKNKATTLAEDYLAEIFGAFDLDAEIYNFAEYDNILAFMEKSQDILDYLEASGNYDSSGFYNIQSLIYRLNSLLDEVRSIETPRVNFAYAYTQGFDWFKSIPQEALDEYKEGLAEVIDHLASDEVNAELSHAFGEQFAQMFSEYNFSEIAHQWADEVLSGLTTKDTYFASIDQFLDAMVQTGALSQVGANMLRAYCESLIDIGEAYGGADDGAKSYVQSLENISAAMQSFEKHADVLKKAREEMAAMGTISPDTFSDMLGMLDDGENILDYLDVENGKLKLNEEAWQKRNETKAEGMLSGLEQEAADLQAILDKEAAGEEYVLPIDYASIDEVRKRFELLTQTIAKIKEAGDLDDGEIDLGLTNMQTELDTLVQKASTVQEMYDGILKGVAVSQEDIFALMSDMPELSTALAGAGSIEEQRVILEQEWAEYETLWQKIIDDQLALMRGRLVGMDQSSEEYSVLSGVIAGLEQMRDFDLSGMTSEVKEVESSIVSLADAIDAVGKAAEFNLSSTDNDTGVLDLLEQAQSMADDLNKVQYHGKNDWDWTFFINKQSSIAYQKALEEYEAVVQEMKTLGIDASRQIFGNVDLGNRQILEWTTENLEQYKDAYESFGITAEELMGSISTVLGGSYTYDGIEIAYTPILQTSSGPKLLDAETLDKYIWSLIDEAAADGSWTNEELFELDARGLEMDGMYIKGMIADIGDTARTTSEAMHYLGAYGALDIAEGAVKAASAISDLNNIQWDDSSIRTYSDAMVDLYLSTNNITNIAPEAVQALKDMAYQAAVAEVSAASLTSALDAINSTQTFRAAISDDETSVLELLEQAQSMADAFNQIRHPDDRDWGWMDFVSNLDTATSLKNIEWSDAALREYSDALIDSYISSTNLAETNPELVQELKETAYQATEAAQKIELLTNAMDKAQSATSVYESIQEDLKSGSTLSLDTMSSLIDLVDKEWTDLVDITSAGFTLKAGADIGKWFETYIDNLVKTEEYQKEFGEDAAKFAEGLKATFNASLATPEDGAPSFDSYTTLQERLEQTAEFYNLLAQAQQDVIDNGALSADTLQSFISTFGSKDWMKYVSFDGNDFMPNIMEIEAEIDRWINSLDFSALGENAEAAKKSLKDMFKFEPDALQDLDDALSKVDSAANLLADIQSEIGDTGTNSLESLQSLIGLMGERWTEAVTFTENGFTIQAQAIKNYVLEAINALDVEEELKKKMQAALDVAVEKASAYDALSSAMDRISTASSLLTDIQSDEGDPLSMLRQAAKMAEESESSISDFVKVVGDDLVWSEEAITEWATKSVDALSEYTEITPELRKYLIELAVAEVQAATSAEKMALAYEKANAALAGMPNRGDLVALTYESYNELIKTDKRYATAVEYQNGVLTLNRDIYAGLTESILNETKAQALANMQAILAGDEYTTLIGKLGTLSDKEQQRLTDLNAEIMGYQVLISEIDNANDAYARFLRASTDTQSSRYSTLQNALQVVKDTLINSKSDIFGKIGREQYISAVKLLIDPEIEVGTKAFDKARKTIERYVTDDIKGVQNFYDDLVTHGFIDSNRQLSGSAEEMASKLGISMNLLRGMIDELNQYQTEENQIKVNFDSDDVEKETKSVEQQVAELHQMITDLNTDLDISHEITLETSAAETAIGRISSALSDLLNKMAKLNGMKINMYANLVQTVSTVASVAKNVVTSGLSNFLSGLTGKATAGGTRNFSGGRTLVGELGPETVVDPEKGMWYTVGRSGAEFVNLPKGAIVFNARQTAELFKSGRISDRGQAMAFGGGSLDKAAITADGDFSPIKSTVKEITEAAVEGAVEGASNGVETVHNGELARPGGNGGNKGGSGGKSKEDKIKDLADAYEEANSYLEHLIRHQEHLYEVAENGMDFAGMEASLTEQAKLYRQMMAESKQTVDAMIAAGADDTDEELQKVEETYWAAYSNLYDILQQMNELYVNALQDKIDSIQSSFDSFTSMIDEINKDGTMTVDTFQKLTSQGLQFLNYLELVDGQYVINREALEKLLAAQTEQLAIEQALAYVAQIKQALVDQDAEKIAHLINLTNEIGNSTWDLVYANAALLKTMGLDDDQYAALIHNLDMLRGMSAQVNTGLSSSTGEYDKQGDALDKILEYTKDLIKYETKERIEALEEEIDAYEKLIDQRKEALKLAREEEDYNKSVKDQTKEIAQLQARIAQLSLDDSREARAERAGLEAELAKLQSGLADTQDDHAYEQQTAALDKSAEEYAAKKQQEIKLLEDSISSEEKLYQAALQRISTSWDTLYSDLINWNMAAGNSLNSEIAEAWKVALEAAKEYGTYVDAIVAKTGNPMVTVASPTEEVPKYHSGGIVKANGIQRNEVVAVLEEGEEVLTQSQRTGLYRIVDFAKELSAKLGSAIGTLTLPSLDVNPALAGMGTVGGTLVSNDNAFTFSPVINVQIGSAGDLSPTTARSYGREIGEIAMQEMKEAFTRRGISNIFNNGLKQ